MSFKIYYYDTDAGGLVYHANYLKYCDKARSDLFLDSGIELIINDSQFVVKKIECDYKVSAKLGDELYVDSIIKDIKNYSFSIEQNIYRDRELLFSANIILAYVNHSKLVKIPKSIYCFLKSRQI